MNADLIKIAFIGGGLYEIDGIENIVEKYISTPFGDPSDKIIIGTMFFCLFRRQQIKNRFSNNFVAGI
ncbi:MAG: hypothetical protein LBS81_02420 [Endomicrobium sp.]|jgi:purine nucleoside phosphorylase|nr:hypothetical protein [Endomicrobium sp.]